MKTLKELIKLIDTADHGILSCHYFIDPDDIQEAAKEWIKEINEVQYGKSKYAREREIDGVIINCSEYTCDIIEEWIRHFFNLGEDDE